MSARRLFGAALVAVSALLAAPPAGAATALDQARSRANAAARDLARAESALAVAQRESRTLDARVAANEEALAGATSALRSDAVDRFLRAGRDRSPEVGGSETPAEATERRRADLLAELAVETELGALDRFRAAAEDLARDRAALRARRQASTEAVAEVRQRRQAIDRELTRLAKLEAQRIAAEKAKAARSAAPARPRASTGSSTGTVPARPAGRFAAEGSWTCPVQGPRAFSDDYGDSRNGGTRRHQGNDLLAPKGTPVVAPVAGSVRRHDNRLGGISFYLSGSDGILYYGAHLDSYAGLSGAVAQGTVIGWVGNTGDARGGPNHLHFEMHPGGGAPVNPYPTLRAHC